MQPYYIIDTARQLFYVPDGKPNASKTVEIFNDTHINRADVIIPLTLCPICNRPPQTKPPLIPEWMNHTPFKYIAMCTHPKIFDQFFNQNKNQTELCH